jgi:Entericidin EcnA/B family.
MRLKVLISLAIMGCMALAGCANTVAGAGEDITNAGHAISKTAK